MVHYELSGLSYGHDGLEPFLSSQSLYCHRAEHRLLVDGLNDTLQRMGGGQHPQHISSILSDLQSVPAEYRSALSFFGGGFENHRMLWESLRPLLVPTDCERPDSPCCLPRPAGSLGDAVDVYFGGFAEFHDRFSALVAAPLQKSGWCWLVMDSRYNRLEIMRTCNNDSPWMLGRIPLLGLDLWEHAYYIDYQDDVARYVAAWWHAINWTNIEDRFSRLSGHP